MQRRLDADQVGIYLMGENTKILINCLEVLAVAVDADGIASIEANGCLIKPLGMIVMRVRAEDRQMPLLAISPLVLQVTSTIAEPTAKVENNIMTIASLNAHASGPTAVDPCLLDIKPFAIRTQRFRAQFTT